MKRLRILTIAALIISIMISIFKKKNPTTIPGGEGLVIKKEWLVTNKQPQNAAKDTRPHDKTT